MTGIKRLSAVLGWIALSIQMFADGPPSILWKKYAHDDRVNSLKFSPDGTLLASGSSDRLIHFHRVSDGVLVKTLNSEAEPIHENSIESLAFSPNGNLLAAVGYRFIQIWRLSDNTLLRTLTNHTDWVLSAAFSPDGQYLATGSFDTTILLWNTSNWTIRKTFTHEGQVRAVSYSSDNLHLATGAGDSQVRVWHVPDGPLHEILNGHTSDVESVAFSPNGSIIASGSQDTTIKLWNMSNNQLIRTLSGHDYFVYSLAFSPDGQRLASIAGSRLNLWRVSDGMLMRSLTEETQDLTALAFTTTNRLAYGRADGAIVFACMDCLSMTSATTSEGDPYYRVIGPRDQIFALQTSSNLVNWTNLQTNTLSTLPFVFSDSGSTTRKYFRAVKVP